MTEPPDLKIVSERTEAEVAGEAIGGELRWQLRELAANLMRVVRGAGKPYQIGAQCLAVVRSCSAFYDVRGEYPSSYDLSNMLNIARDFDGRERSGRHLNWDFAEQQLVRGALQIAASELVSQNTQRIAGEREMFDGVTAIEKQREESRRELNSPASRKSRAELSESLAKRAARKDRT